MNRKLTVIAFIVIVIVSGSFLVYFLNLNFITLAPGGERPQGEVIDWKVIAPILGVVGGITGLFKQVYSEFTERRKRVVIDYGSLFKSNIYQLDPGFKRFANSYYLRILKTKGESGAEDVRGFMSLEGTEIHKMPLKWYLEAHEKATIYDYKDLWLFSFEDFNNPFSSLWFFHASDQMAEPQIIKRLTDIRGNKLIINVEGKNAKLPKRPFIETIENIMSKAVDM